MSTSKISFEESLEKAVLPKNCAGCAACVIVCPFGSLEYAEENPRLVKKCEACGICPKACPRYNLPLPDLEKLVYHRERRSEEEFGIYRRVVASKATDEKTLRVCQDGGLATTLLTFALESGLIDGAAVSGLSQDKPFYPVPTLATTPREVLECAGTRYTYSPNLLAFQEGVRRGKRSLAFVGTPCQIQALRRIEAIPLKKYANAVRFTIGLMCTESLSYEGLMEKHVQETLGIHLHDVEKINIKGRVLVRTKAGEVKTIPLSEAKRYTRKGCSACTDFSAELADISVGGLGLSGWTFTVLRTEKGEEIFEKACSKGMLTTKPVEEGEASLDLLIRLSKRKRENVM